ncbi:unnamed protein product [Symbiodinium natans]|uniref:Uncharacterized protein n=1 Tax=Symbiodinium natans TaxID=878477 RepID=A0A812TZY1_9DINO|nr:unnamed protein product [Symbiodinium natans]
MPSRIHIRAGDSIAALAEATCRHLQSVGAGGCQLRELTDIQESLHALVEGFNNISLGEQTLKQLQFGWDLFLTYRAFEEARLHFITALARFPTSRYLLRELAAASTLAFVLPRSGDANVLHWGANGTWAHVTPPKVSALAEAFDGWETYSTVRFQQPLMFLSEEEPELLRAHMPPHGFFPCGEIRTTDSNVGILGLVYEHRLQHDMELIQVLRDLKLIQASTAEGAIAAYSRVLGSAEHVDGGFLRPTHEHWHSLYPFHNRRLYVHPSPRLSLPALNPYAELDIQLLRSQAPTPASSRAGGFLATGGVLVIDHLLSGDALMHLRDFAELSTIWYQERPHYLGAGFSTGFSSPLLAQIAEELQGLLADVLCDLPLANVWAFKYEDGSDMGIDLHADAAAVNVNLWITPNTVNLDNATGGLVIFDASVDERSSSFELFNQVGFDTSRESALSELISRSGSANVTVPYRQNRAVIFDSARIHTTQRLDFKKSGVRSRRINITFLFGAKGTYCPLRRAATVVLDE